MHILCGKWFDMFYIDQIQFHWWISIKIKHFTFLQLNILIKEKNCYVVNALMSFLDSTEFDEFIGYHENIGRNMKYPY